MLNSMAGQTTLTAAFIDDVFSLVLLAPTPGSSGPPLRALALLGGSAGGAVARASAAARVWQGAARERLWPLAPEHGAADSARRRPTALRAHTGAAGVARRRQPRPGPDRAEDGGRLRLPGLRRLWRQAPLPQARGRALTHQVHPRRLHPAARRGARRAPPPRRAALHRAALRRAALHRAAPASTSASASAPFDCLRSTPPPRPPFSCLAAPCAPPPSCSDPLLRRCTSSS
jgi:hypothetical protein